MTEILKRLTYITHIFNCTEFDTIKNVGGNNNIV